MSHYSDTFKMFPFQINTYLSCLGYPSSWTKLVLNSSLGSWLCSAARAYQGRGRLLSDATLLIAAHFSMKLTFKIFAQWTPRVNEGKGKRLLSQKLPRGVHFPCSNPPFHMKDGGGSAAAAQCEWEVRSHFVRIKAEGVQPKSENPFKEGTLLFGRF